MNSVVHGLAVLWVVGCASIVLAGDADATTKSLVSMEFSIVELPQAALSEKSDRVGALDADSTEKLIARIHEMETKNQLGAWTRVRLSTVEECRATAQFGERAPVVSGRGSFGTRGGERGPGNTAFTMQEFGTLIVATPRVEESGSILIDLEVEKSAPARRDAGTPPNAESGVPESIGTIHVKSTVRVQNGKTVIVQGMSSSSGKDAAPTVILLTAHADQPAKTATAKRDVDSATQEIKIFYLRNAQASSVASIVTSLFAGQPLNVGVDERTNCLIVRSDSRQLELIRVVLMRLDEDPATEPTDK